MISVEEVLSAYRRAADHLLLLPLTDIGRLDAAIERAATEHGLVQVPLLCTPEPEDPNFDAATEAYTALVETVKGYMEENKGYEVETLIYPNRIAFMVLWKRGSPGDPAIDRVLGKAQPN